VRLWRTLPRDRIAAVGEVGGPLWFPREQQGYGRHDNPELYGCIYAAEDPVSALAEALARFRGTGRLTGAELKRAGRPLAIAEIEFDDRVATLDLDDPKFLAGRELRPSLIATHHRELTQGIAADLFTEYPDAAGMRWWSTFEGTWMNWTLFDRAAGALELVEVAEARLDDPSVREAAELLGLTP